MPGIPAAYKNLLLKYRDAFDVNVSLQKSVPGHRFDIELTDTSPIYHKPRPIPAKYTRKLRRLLRKYVRHNIITPVPSSKYLQPIHVVPKSDDTLRITLDLRVLNARTVPSKHSIPRIQDILSTLRRGSLNFITHLDMKDAFFNIECTERAKRYLVFSTMWHNFRLNRLVMGGVNSAECLQGILAVLFYGKTYLIIYIDDIIIFSRTQEEHLTHVAEVLKILHENNFTLNLKKCKFNQSSVEFLGYNISAQGITPVRSRCEAIRNICLPQTHTALRSYIGAFNWNRRFLVGSAEVLQPLHNLLDHKAKKKRLSWTPEAVSAFYNSKHSLELSIRLEFFDPDEHISLFTDASDVALSGVLCQTKRKLDRTTAFDDSFREHIEVLEVFSRPLRKNEIKLSIFLKELLAVRDALRYMHTAVYGREVTVFSDNRAVIQVIMVSNKIELKPRVHRIFCDILLYAPTAVFLSTQNNFLADMLSRNCVFARRPLPPLEDDHRRAQGAKKGKGRRSRPNPKPVQGNQIPGALGMIKVTQMDDDYKKLVEEQRADEWVSSAHTQLGNSTLQIVDKDIQGSTYKMRGDISTGFFRPLIPQALRFRFFQKFHNQHHSGIKRTKHEIISLVYWPKMAKDITLMVKACQVCARTKVVRHEKTKLIKWVAQKGKFNTVQIDYAGPLTQVDGFRYVLVIKDRATRFTVLCAMASQEHQELIHTFLNRWIAYFGIPAQLTSDNYKTFVSKPFTDVLNFLGIESKPINAYSPAENALVEVVNRTVKQMLRATESRDNWPTNLPLINLFINNLVGEGGASASQCTYGIQCYTPGVLFEDEVPKYDTAAAERMMHFARELKDTPFRAHPKRPIQDLQLHKATHVYLRVDRMKTAFCPRYSGPHLVLKMGPKSAVISKNNHLIKVSRNRLKPCSFLPLELQDLDSLLSGLNLIPDSEGEINDAVPGIQDPDLAERSDELEEEGEEVDSVEIARELPFCETDAEQRQPEQEEQSTSDTNVDRATRRAPGKRMSHKPYRYGY